jgi:rubredoxin
MMPDDPPLLPLRWYCPDCGAVASYDECEECGWYREDED